MLKNISNICRVCCNPGEHSIFQPIPFYLHELRQKDNSGQWCEPMHSLLQEILHIPITPNDGFPEKICTPCITYLQHAVAFRKKAIASRVGLLQAASLYLKQNPSKEADIPPPPSLVPMNFEDKNDNLKRATVNKVPPKAKLPVSFKKKSDANIPAISVAETKSFFNFRQKPFVEDDITAMSIFDGENFSANPPDKLMQRSCGFCRMYFFLEESYEAHIARCIHKKFTVFIHQCNQTLAMKMERKITYNEFLRRMIFLIQSTHEVIEKLEREGECEEHSDDTTSDSQDIMDPREEDNFSALDTATSTGPPPTMAQEIDLNKKTLCPRCGKGFLTISHLDTHRIRCRH